MFVRLALNDGGVIGVKHLDSVVEENRLVSDACKWLNVNGQRSSVVARLEFLPVSGDFGRWMMDPNGSFERKLADPAHPVIGRILDEIEEKGNRLAQEGRSQTVAGQRVADLAGAARRVLEYTGRRGLGTAFRKFG
jgi:hypothetical protein